MTLVAAVDLGASSGRVMVGSVGHGLLELREAHRFPNRPVTAAGTVYWDVLGLYAEILDGLRAAGAGGEIASIGIDSWGVDYGLLDHAGALLGNPVHYRDGRTSAVFGRVLAEVGAAELYAVTGIAELPINTLVQLASTIGSPALLAACDLLLMPDLLGYWLTGEVGTELTNASTTQLLDVTTKNWAEPIIRRAGLPREIFTRLRQPGDLIGPLLPETLAVSGLPAGTPLRAVASHDTASAVIAVPAADPGFCYISCGTWSLVGVELDRPVLTEESRLASFTNETGVDRTIRYLRNVMGLWLLQESIRTWISAGLEIDLDSLLASAAGAQALRSVVDPDDLEFLPPGDMPARIAAFCARTGQPVPGDPVQTVRCVLDSLALAHWRAIEQVQRLSRRSVDVVHVVGGGSRNSLLCQLTADASGLPVLAGPVEATALGNVLVQARALGSAPGDLAGLRGLVRATQPVRRFEPSGPVNPWRAAAGRLSA
jgi:rhamnulokinase